MSWEGFLGLGLGLGLGLEQGRVPEGAVGGEQVLVVERALRLLDERVTVIGRERRRPAVADLADSHHGLLGLGLRTAAASEHRPQEQHTEQRRPGVRPPSSEACNLLQQSCYKVVTPPKGPACKACAVPQER